MDERTLDLRVAQVARHATLAITLACLTLSHPSVAELMMQRPTYEISSTAWDLMTRASWHCLAPTRLAEPSKSAAAQSRKATERRTRAHIHRRSQKLALSETTTSRV